MNKRLVFWHLGALALYSVLSWLLLDRGAGLTNHILGYTSDPSLIMWFLAWWPWALTHHVTSLTTHLVWQPAGLNIAWTTCVPLLALLAAPITLLVGPLLSFNVLTLAAPVLAAWAAYFLCLELEVPPLAALFGGLYFGFSSYEAAQLFDHLNLDFTVLIPLILLVALRRLRGRTGHWAASIWLGVLLGGEFLISEELLATSCLFSAIAFTLAWINASPWRPALRAFVFDLACAAPIALLLASPILWAMLTGPHDMAHPADWGTLFCVDALNFIVPTLSSWLGGSSFGTVSQLLSGGLDEQTGYLGWPFLALLYVLLRYKEARRRWWLPLAMLGVVLLASLGGTLWIGGHNTGIPLPWAIIAHVPLLGEALPARCMLYAALLGGIILALWVGQAPTRRRVLVASLACVFVLPAPRPVEPSPALTFFQPGRVQAVLGVSPRLLILPFSIAGQSSYWQAEDNFGFTQVGGYLGYPPRWAQRDPAVLQLFSNSLTADFARLCHLRGVRYVIATPATTPEEKAALAALDWPAQKIDDVTVFTVPKS
jgi:hypothetical protein